MIDLGMGRRALLRCLLSWAVPVVGATGALWGQGPAVAYYYQPAVELPWAECSVSLGGGSRVSLPFLPAVVEEVHAPVGTRGFAADVSVDAPMAFVGNGIVSEGWDAYRNTWAGNGAPLDVAGRAVVLCYDCPQAGDAAGPSHSPAALGERLRIAARRGAAAAVVFSAANGTPFLALAPDQVPEPEIPVVSLSRHGAAVLLEAAGVGGEEALERLAGGEDPPKSQDLITRLRLRFDGAFERVESDHFVFLFRSSAIPRSDVDRVSEVHEESLATIRRVLGSAGDPQMPRGTTVYFAGFDSKTFYTHHWGSGLAGNGRVFLIWPGTEVDLGLIAHENAHTFTGNAWGGSSSFLDEGVARLVEAEATDPDMNHAETHRRLVQDALPPLEVMLPIDVGGDELTPVAYPAAGSFVGYLRERYGLATLREVYRLEGRSAEEKADADTWTQALGEPLSQVDREWRDWLRRKKGG